MLTSTMLRALSLAAVVLVAGHHSLTDATAAETLRIMSWQGYADDDWVAQFEKATGADVSVTFVASDDEIWAKMQGSKGQDYDIFAVNSAQLQRYIDGGMVSPIDLEKVPNQKNYIDLFRDLSSVKGLTRDGKVYGMPFAFDSIGIIYDVEKVNPPPTSMNILWDPKYKGKVLGYDNGEYNFSFTALAMGYVDPFHLSEDQYEKIAERLHKLKDNVLTFYTNMDDATQIYLNNDVALIWANFGQQQVKAMKAAGANVAYVNAKEGALAWLDNWAITSGVRDIDLAHKWLDFMAEKRVGTEMSERTGYGNAVGVTDNAKPGDVLRYVEPVENPTRRSDMWNEIKAAP